MFRCIFLLSVVVWAITCTAVLAAEIEDFNELRQLQYVRSSETIDDCSNTTHRWHSSGGSCFDEEDGAVPLASLPLKRSILDDYLGFVGLYPRAICGQDETTCWAVSCCRPGEVCGSINEGCKISWSTIYTTTVTTLWSTVTSWVVPTSAVDYTTITVNETTYTTIFNPVTLPGEGQDDVIGTDMVILTTLVLSAFTPPAITVTEMVTRTLDAVDITAPPLLLVRETGNLLPRVETPPRKSAGTSYTTLTVYITTFFTTSMTATLSNSILEATTTMTISSVATQNQTHYETPTGFVTFIITETSTSTSYAYGTVDAPTRVYYITTSVPNLADGTVLNGSGPAGRAVPGSGRLSKGAIAGLSIGLILAVVLVAAGFFFFIRRYNGQSRRGSVKTRKIFDSSRPSGPPAQFSPRSVMTNVPRADIIMPASRAKEVPAASPISELFFSGLNMTGEENYTRNADHVPGALRLSRDSRGSLISAGSPVPEEYILPETPATTNPQMRSSVDARNWGRGYGGRGGYYNVGERNKALSSDFEIRF